MPDLDKVYTYSDYLNFPEDEIWEIIDGVPYILAVPSWEHQFISGALHGQFYVQLEGSPCKAVVAPFDLRLPYKNEKDEEVSTVVQPDILGRVSKEVEK